MSKLSERDVCSKFITPALVSAGWDLQTQIREEVSFTKGRIIVRGKLHSRGKGKRADYVLYTKPNQPIALIEAKDQTHSLGAGMQQGLDYAETLDIPFVFSSNGDGFLFHDRTGNVAATETELKLTEFPSPAELWQRYCVWKGLAGEAVATVETPYYDDGSGRIPRYYQVTAVNRTVEAVARGQDRILLVMATGTGKTYTAFQIIWRLWKSKQKKRILFLADRNILVDQTRTNDFKPFGAAMTKIEKRQANKAYEIYLSLYQAVTGNEEEKNIYKQFSPDFFDLIIIDECHRGSAAEDSAWREILDYFSGATQIGLTATPKETKEVSNIHYFGDPVYTYSLKQGIDDGFLAPYKVVRIDIDKDLQGWRPAKGQTDKHGNLIEDRIYNQKDFDRKLITESLKDYTRKAVRKEFASLDDFLRRWTDTEKKQALIEELEAQGVLLEALAEEVGKKQGKTFDPFDLICHVAFDRPALTRKERAEQVKKKDVFAKYGEKARAVLNSLLDKYADAGIESIEDIKILTLDPFSKLGTAPELVGAFGGKPKYLQAVQELESLLYSA